MIVITGANGRLGRAVVGHLLTRTSPDRIGVSVRDVAAAQPLADRGVRVRYGDFDDPSSLAHAFAGAEQVLTVSVDRAGPDAVAAQCRAIDAAVEAGARRILYTSHMAAGHDAVFGHARHQHIEVEDHLAGTGVAFTALRDGFHASSAALMLDFHTTDGVLAVPDDGPVAWTDVGDLAEAAAVILAGESIDGPTPPLTAEATHTLAEVADMARGAGRPLTVKRLGDDEYRHRLADRGLPEAAVEDVFSFFLAARCGELGRTDPMLGTLLGRPPRSLASVLPDLLARTDLQWRA